MLVACMKYKAYQSCERVTLLEGGDDRRDYEEKTGDVCVVHEAEEPGDREEGEDDGIRTRGKEVAWGALAFVECDESRNGERKGEEAEEGSQSED